MKWAKKKKFNLEYIKRIVKLLQTVYVFLDVWCVCVCVYEYSALFSLNLNCSYYYCCCYMMLKKNLLSFSI